MIGRPLRLEWIYLVYLICFALAVLAPSIYTRGYFGLSETVLEELTIFVFGLTGLFVFTKYERLIEGGEREQEERKDEYLRVKSELIESYAYIGSMNRKLELLKRVANDASVGLGEKKVLRELFGALVSHAAAAADGEVVLLRFLEVANLRTVHEFWHVTQGGKPLHVANKDLRAVLEEGATHAFIRNGEGKDLLVVPSDTSRETRAFLIFSWKEGATPELDVSLLKVFANQAESLSLRTFTPPLPEPEKKLD